MAEPSRKRTFQARELVWSTFETMARERGADVDDLVQEAMAAYARSRGYPVDGRGLERELEETQDGRSMSPLDRSYGKHDDLDDLARTSMRETNVPPSDDFYESETRTRPRYMPGIPMPRSPSRLPPPNLPDGRSSRPPGREAGKRLVLTYEGQPYPVEKERFLLGRSRSQADLRLDDPNVSRQHAVIERVGSAWYVVDLGSTNGVIIGGERIARRALADGDVIVITAHEIRCSLR